jgi:small multidrug resistance family-3 protein
LLAICGLPSGGSSAPMLRGIGVGTYRAVSSGVILATFPLVELLALFSIWNWSRRQRSFGWLVLGWLLAGALISVAVMCSNEIPARVYAGFFGMYLFSALAWAWVCDGLNPEKWSVSEGAVALVSVALFSIATGGLG